MGLSTLAPMIERSATGNTTLQLLNSDNDVINVLVIKDFVDFIARACWLAICVDCCTYLLLQTLRTSVTDSDKIFKIINVKVTQALTKIRELIS